jgi:hypothetical protein
MVINGLFTEAFWYVTPILAAVVIPIAGAINQKFNITGDMIKNVISWRQIVAMLVSLVITLGAYFIGWTPDLGEPTWLSLVCQFGVVTASAGWGYDIKVIKNWINTWFVKK